MGVKFKLVLNDQEQLIYHCLNIVNLSNQVTTKIQHVMSTLPDLSSEGAYHDLIANSETNIGLGLFNKKAQEFQVISEVLYRHAQNTYEKMVNTDKVLATAIAEMILKDPTSRVEDKEAIRKDPKGSVEKIMKNRQAEAQESGAK
jgi:hypothetical protein